MPDEDAEKVIEECVTRLRALKTKQDPSRWKQLFARAISKPKGTAGRKPKLQRNINLAADYLLAGGKHNPVLSPVPRDVPVPDEELPDRGTLTTLAAKYGITPPTANGIITRVLSDPAQLLKAQVVAISLGLSADSGNAIDEAAISKIIHI